MVPFIPAVWFKLINNPFDPIKWSASSCQVSRLYDQIWEDATIFKYHAPKVFTSTKCWRVLLAVALKSSFKSFRASILVFRFLCSTLRSTVGVRRSSMLLQNSFRACFLLLHKQLLLRWATLYWSQSACDLVRITLLTSVHASFRVETRPWISD